MDKYKILRKSDASAVNIENIETFVRVIAFMPRLSVSREVAEGKLVLAPETDGVSL